MHGLFGCAGEDGVLECFDLRSRTSIGSLSAAAAAGAVSTLPVPVLSLPTRCLPGGGGGGEGHDARPPIAIRGNAYALAGAL